EIVSSWSALLIPQIIPPKIWLRAVLGLIILPAATVVNALVTLTIPNSSSTSTSTKTALWAALEYFLNFRTFGIEDLVTLISLPSLAFTISAKVTMIQGLSVRESLPLAIVRSFSFAFPKAEFSIFWTAFRSCLRNALLAAFIADTIVATVKEPPWIGANSILLSA